MRFWKNKWFSRFARQQGISDLALCEAVARADRGLIDADLGGGVIKQRIARPGAGKSGGFRAVILFRVEEKAFFVFGFAKSDLDNISDRELEAFKDLAQELLGRTDAELEVLVERGVLTEVQCDEDL